MLDCDLHRLVTQPIVDLVRGTVVGHEALSRFPDHAPDVWFNVAKGEGLSDVLDARVIGKALQLRSALPPDTFLTINVEPSNLLSPRVIAALDTSQRLDRIVLELTEHFPLNNSADLQTQMAHLRERGALIALDDVGAGYAGLQIMLQSRPDLVKIDRALVDHLDLDPAKQAMVQMLGQLAGRMDAWLLAEGIERHEELGELIRLQVPLGQGYLLGRPGEEMLADLPPELGQYIITHSAQTRLHDVVAGLVDPMPHVSAEDQLDPDKTAIVVDAFNRPTGLWVEGTLDPDPLLVKPSEQVPEVAGRMAARTGPHQLFPAVVVNAQGTPIGVLWTNRLLRHLADHATAT